MYTMFSDSGYLLENGDVVAQGSYEKYFAKYVKVFAYDHAEFRKVELDTRLDQFVLEYALPADWCGTCDDAGVTEGLCEGHNEPHQEFINYTRVEVYI